MGRNFMNKLHFTTSPHWSSVCEFYRIRNQFNSPDTHFGVPKTLYNLNKTISEHYGTSFGLLGDSLELHIRSK